MTTISVANLRRLRRLNTSQRQFCLAKTYEYIKEHGPYEFLLDLSSNFPREFDALKQTIGRFERAKVGVLLDAGAVRRKPTGVEDGPAAKQGRGRNRGTKAGAGRTRAEPGSICAPGTVDSQALPLPHDLQG